MSKIERRLLKCCNIYLPLLRMVPFLRFVGVCNNLSFGKVDKNSDIDLFIIAKKGRLFFVRSFVTLILQLMGVRRHGDKIAGRFCLSFFIDDSDLCLKKVALDRDFYLAYWVKSLLPVIDDGVFSEFVAANDWANDLVEEDLPAKDVHFDDSDAFSDLACSVFTSFFSGRFGDLLESWLQSWQLSRAELKRSRLNDSSGVVISPHMLKFHNEDRRAHYNRLCRKSLSGDGSSSSVEKRISYEDFLKLIS